MKRKKVLLKYIKKHIYLNTSINKFTNMRKFLHLFAFIFFSVFNSNSQEVAYLKSPISENVVRSTENSLTVYICMGQYAEAYHSRPDCAGLGNCKSDIKYTDEYTAVNNFRRRPCCRCWSLVGDNCKDDLASSGGAGGGGGGGDGSAAAVIAGVVIVASAAVLSNDIYVYPTFSFKNGSSRSTSFQQGWALGFRKTFKKSALEYGLTFIEPNNNESSSTGFHFNYVHQILSPKNDKLSFYLGPALSIIDETGFGGIIGSSYSILNRLKLDMRYELTSQTNNFKIGLIYNYQKRYFWQK
jgi:hypothetical protein